MSIGDDVVLHNPGDVEYLSDSRIGTTTSMRADGGIDRPDVFSWEITTTPRPGEGDPTTRTILLTGDMLTTIGAQIVVAFTNPT